MYPSFRSIILGDWDVLAGFSLRVSNDDNNATVMTRSMLIRILVMGKSIRLVLTDTECFEAYLGVGFGSYIENPSYCKSQRDSDACAAFSWFFDLGAPSVHHTQTQGFFRITLQFWLFPNTPELEKKQTLWLSRNLHQGTPVRKL